MCSTALSGNNIGEFLCATPHFKQPNANYFLIVYLKAFPQDGHWFPKCDLLVQTGSKWTNSPSLVLCRAKSQARYSLQQHVYYHNSYTEPHQALNWLVNCSESLNCTPMTDWCRLRDCGICVNISPCHLIHPLFLLPSYRAWSMRLDLQCNGIKHIVSHLCERRIELIKPPTCPAGKLIKELEYRTADLYFSC